MQNMINFVFCFIGYNLADLAVIQSGLADLENLAVIGALSILSGLDHIFFDNGHEF